MRPVAARIAHDVPRSRIGGWRPPPEPADRARLRAIAELRAAPAKVDDRTVDYCRARGFETLGDAPAALRRCSSSKPSGARIPRDHPALGRARSDLAEAEAVIRAGRTTPPAAHPHRHLVASADRLGAVERFDVEASGHRRAPNAGAPARGWRPPELGGVRLAGFRDRGAGRGLRLLRGAPGGSATDGDLLDLGVGIRLRAGCGGGRDCVWGLRQPPRKLPYAYPSSGGASSRSGYGRAR